VTVTTILNLSELRKVNSSVCEKRVGWGPLDTTFILELSS